MIGTKISHYRILEKIGCGGMGDIYKAEDLKLGRVVALKFLSPQLTKEPEAKQRFIHEARAASALQHNHICTIHDIDETEDGQMYICMDFYEGETLKNLIARGPLAIDRALEITLQIAHGLAAAHAAGQIHRDIKPANIMILDQDQVKIVDFGLAKLSGATRLTETGKSLGTVAYMSPEQALGKDTDHRTDIWSLGVVLYEMITGQLPFAGEYDTAILYGIVNENAPPPTSLRSGVPLALEQVLVKCLEKNAGNRYQHIDELIVDLRRLQKKTVPPDTFSKTRPADRRVRRFRIGYVLPALLVLSLVAAVVYLLLTEWRGADSSDGQIKTIAVLPFDDLSPGKDQEYLCDGMTEQITTNLSRLRDLQVRGRNSVMKFKNSGKTIPQIARELRVSYLLEGSIRRVADRIRVTVQLIKADEDYHLWANDYDRELDDVFAVQDDIARSVTGLLLTHLSGKQQEQIKSRPPASREAYEYFIKGRYYHHKKFYLSINKEDFKISEQMLLKAVELDPAYSPAYEELADLYNSYYFTQKLDPGEKAKYIALQEGYLARAFDLDSSSANLYRVLGAVLLAKGEDDKAYHYFRKSVEMDPQNAINLSELGYLYIRYGLYESALKCMLKAVEIDPLDINLYYMIAVAYWNTGQHQPAETYFLKALEIDPEETATQYFLARLWFDMKKYENFQQVRLRLEKQGDRPEHLKYLLALQYILEGDKEKALATYVKPDPEKATDFLILRVYNHFGMVDEFIRYLDADFTQLEMRGFSSYLWLKNDSLFDGLRGDPRFTEVLVKYRRLYELNERKYPPVRLDQDK